VGYAKVTRDLTERKEAIDALRATQEELVRSNEELQHLAAAAAHDLAAPIQTISGFADLLQARNKDTLDDDSREFVALIQSSAGHMRSLVRELSDYARAGQETIAVPTPVAPAIASAVHNLTGEIEGSRADIQIEVPDDAAVQADPVSLERIFQNLLSNAVKFGPEADARVRVEARTDGQSWRFEVIDEGPGIDEGEVDLIFQPFRHGKKVKQAGSGLGLAICRKIVDRYGGDIGVEPAPEGAGCCFWFSLPAAGD
jgi:signal transduction histidine kinase